MTDATASSVGEPEASDRLWDATIVELLRIRLLEDDWDGEGTEAPGHAVVDRAIALAQDLRSLAFAPPDRVHACVNPTVCFEWHNTLCYTEIEVVSPIEVERRSVRLGST